MACAAIRPATRIRSMISGLFTSGPSYGIGPGRSTYSGRAMDEGTVRRGEIVPGSTAVMVAMPCSLGAPSVTAHPTCAAQPDTAGCAHGVVLLQHPHQPGRRARRQEPEQ